MITSVAAGSTAVVVALPTWGFAALDANGFVLTSNLPISNEQGKRALAASFATGSEISWLSYVEDAMQLSHGVTTDATNIAYNGAFWPITGPGSIVWTFIQNTLSTALGGFSNAQLAALQLLAATNR